MKLNKLQLTLALLMASTAVVAATDYEIRLPSGASPAAAEPATPVVVAKDGALNASTTSAIALHTSLISATGVASASPAVFNSSYAWKLFDGSSSAGAYVLEPTASFTYQFNTPININKYGLMQKYLGSPDYKASSWSFEGSNDGATWDVLDVVPDGQGLNSSTSTSFVYYNFVNGTEYTHYKITIDNLERVSSYEMRFIEAQAD